MSNENKDILEEIRQREINLEADVHLANEQIRNLWLYLREILAILKQGLPATGGKIVQIGENMTATPNGITPGGQGVFQVTWNGAMQDGNVPVWTASDPAATITPSADGMTAQVALAATDTLTSFALTATGVNSVGATVTATLTVAVNPVVPPPPAPATGGTITQIG